MTAILETRGLTKAFGGLVAVGDVDFAVEEGGITGIIGPNGAGKSTFFNLISLFYRSTSGTITFRGEDVTRLRTHDMPPRGMARTFQTTHLFAEASVLENVIVGYRHRTRAGLLDALIASPRERREIAEARRRAMEALDFVGLADVAHRPAGLISQEQQKRAAIALGLVGGPRLLLLDEPAAGINPEETDDLGRLIRRIAEAGVTVCLIEHKMKMVMGLCDRIMVLHHGRKIAEGTPDQIRTDDAVITAYLGSDAHAHA
ncbi:ABC transporter ATP-binding protein [Tistrella mobilis]|uniref:ABC transporter ATP-binding protein n=1 Tax=Tistrella mobilis TaxID=171437 RepID=A0A162LCB1_9PROT|nr:ABC transporter ATP-binding protein [Tistrella mobilis]KYO54344.1 ABC transporter ATP-binding protein [Tistrella mobilis]